MLDLTLLGTGGGMPMPNRFLSSMIISYKGRKILIDCGEGTQVAMRKFKTGSKSLDIICITHCHGDHIFGLPGLLSTMGNSDRIEPITIIGPEGIIDVMNSFLNLIPYLPFEIKIIENPITPLYFHIEEGHLKLKEEGNPYNEEIIISTLDLEHSTTCIGYGFYSTRKPEFLPERALEKGIPQSLWGKLQNGEIIVFDGKTYTPNMVLGEARDGIKLTYITDTRPIVSIVDFISDSDLFVCEGTYGEGEDLDKAIKNFHMTFAEASELAHIGNVDELLLTHFSTAMDDVDVYIENAKEKFSNVILGYDGLQKQINYR